jgi:hypothetical protein
VGRCCVSALDAVVLGVKGSRWWVAERRALVDVYVIDGGVWISCAMTNRYTSWNSWTDGVTLWDSDFCAIRASSTCRIPPSRLAGGGTAENCAQAGVDSCLQLCNAARRRADDSVSSPSTSVSPHDEIPVRRSRDAHGRRSPRHHRCACLYAPRLGSEAGTRNAGSGPTPHPAQRQASAVGAE